MSKGFKEPKIHSIKYTPNNITLIIQPVPIPVPQHVHYIPPTESPLSLTYVSPYPSFAPTTPVSYAVPVAPATPNAYTGQVLQVTQSPPVPFATSETKIALKSIGKLSFFGKRNVKKQDPLDSLVYDSTIPVLEKLAIVDKAREKLEKDDIDREVQLKIIDAKIEQAIKNRSQLDEALDAARIAKDKATGDRIKAEQEFSDGFRDYLADKKAIQEKEALEKKERILNSKEELYKKNLEPREHNSLEVEEHYPLMVQTLLQYKSDYEGFNRQIISNAIPIQLLNTLLLKKTDSVDSHVVDLVLELLKTNQLSTLKMLDLSDNPKSIGSEQIDKLSDAFLSGNCKVETLDISCALPAAKKGLFSLLMMGKATAEHLGYDSVNEGTQVSGESSNMLLLQDSFKKLVLSISTCAQPLCITIDSHIPTKQNSYLTAMDLIGGTVQKFSRSMGLDVSIMVPKNCTIKTKK